MCHYFSTNHKYEGIDDTTKSAYGDVDGSEACMDKQY